MDQINQYWLALSLINTQIHRIEFLTQDWNLQVILTVSNLLPQYSLEIVGQVSVESVLVERLVDNVIGGFQVPYD